MSVGVRSEVGRVELSGRTDEGDEGMSKIIPCTKGSVAPGLSEEHSSPPRTP